MLWEKKHMAGEQSRHFRILIHWALTPYKPYIFWRHGEACGRVSSTHVGQPSFFGSLEAGTVTSPSQTSNPSNLVQQGAPSLCLWCLPPLAPLWSHSGASSGSCAWSLTVLSFLLSRCPSCCWFSLFICASGVSLPETSNIPPRAIKVDDWILPAKPSLSVTWSLWLILWNWADLCRYLSAPQSPD